MPAARTPFVTAPQTLLQQKVFVGAGRRYGVAVSGNYLYVDGITYGTSDLSNVGVLNVVTVKPNTAGATADVIYPKRGIQFPENFTVLEFYNPSAYDVFLNVSVGAGKITTEQPRKFHTCNTSFNSGVVGVGVAYAVGESVGQSNQAFNACSPTSQRAVLRSLVCTKQTATLTNADFTLWLFSDSLTVTPANKAPFVFLSGANDYEFLGVVRFPSFATGGAGSTYAYSAVAGLDIDLECVGSANSQGTIYSVLTANAAYVQANEVFNITARVEWIS
jgi:hypothetical protein